MSSLKQVVLQKLHSYPDVKDFWGSCFEERMKRGDWQENPILKALADCQQLESWPKQIKTAKLMLKNYNDFRPTELTGNEPDFDEKMADKNAELRAIDFLYHLKGYKKGNYIPRQKNKKTPDFEVETGEKSALVEVKHKRDPFASYEECFGVRVNIRNKKIENFKNIILRVIGEAEKQLKEYDKDRHKKHIIIICFDLAPGYFLIYDHIENFVKNELPAPWRGEIIDGSISRNGVLVVPSEYPIIFIEKNKSDTILDN